MPLWLSFFRGAKNGRTIPSSTSSSFSSGLSRRAGGMPIGATTSSPTRSAAGGKMWAILGAAKATVRSASTEGPIVSNVSLDRPDGMSTASVKAGDRLISSTASA